MKNIVSKNLKINTIKSLINYSYSISNLYNELYILELKGQKGSQLYNEYIELILKLKDKENEFYDSIPSDLLEEYYKYFENIDNLSKENNKETSKLLFSKSNSYISNRIINRLSYIIDSQCDYNEYRDEYYDEDYDEYYDEYNDPNEEINIVDEFCEDTLDISIVFLDNLVKDLKNVELKNNVLKIKYLTAFFNYPAEKDFLVNEFDLNLNMFNISELKEKNDVSSVAYAYCTKQIKILLKENDNKMEFILGLSLLKACLQFISNKKINKLIEKYSNKKNDNINNNSKVKVLNEMKNV